MTLWPRSFMTLWPRLKLPVWIGVWILTRGLIVAQVGFWDQVGGVELEDVNSFEAWSNFMAANHAMPPEETWQYPPGAAFLMLIPRIGGGDFGISFVVTMLVLDLIGFALISLLARRERHDAGVWVWLLAMPLLFTLPVLRFDMAPTVIAIAALVVIHRRPTWFGALAGLGAMVKVWPIFVLLAEWDRKRLMRSAGAALATIVAVFAIAWIALGDQTGFLSNQGDRGLQIEAVAASPWQLREVIRGTPVPTVQRFGTNEIGSDLADAVGKLLDLVAVAVLAAAAWWWWMRDRAIRRGRTDLEDSILSRDFVFTVVLLFVVVSRVLSPQFMIWLVGLAAVVLTAGRTRLARPAWVVIGAVVLTAGLYQSPANFVIRNLALLVATIEASAIMVAVVLDRHSPSEETPVEAATPVTADST
jgi:glycosyl transferase family 87